MKLRTSILAAALFALNLLLNLPMFFPGEMPFRGSIEGGYASMARFFAEHPDPWGWNPLQYCGLPSQFVYLPGMPYLAAALTWAAPPDYAYRIVAATIACLGPVAVFLCALRFTRSRFWAMVPALALTFFSPSYGLFPIVEKDRGLVVLPWRIQVLAKYGEGPHVAGLTVLPLALMALWRAANGRRILLAAIALAGVVFLNWIAAMALALACLTLLLAGAGVKGFDTRRAFAAAGLAYLLACFWLTPTFIKTIAFNWPADAFGYRFGPRQAVLAACWIGGALIIRWLFARFGGGFWLRFTTLAAFVFGYLAIGFYNFGVDTLPESRRYALEFELFLFLALAEWVRAGLGHRDVVVKGCAMGAAAVLVLSGAGQAWQYATQGWKIWMPVPRERTPEYRMARWIADHPPHGRVFASGGTRYRLNAWFDVPQVGGGFETGLRNRLPVDLAYQIRTGKDSIQGNERADALVELKTLGVEYVVIHGPQSAEYYRDFRNPHEFDGVLPVVYSEGDDRIYALPPTSIARAMRPEELAGSWADAKARALERYASAGQPLTAEWRGNDTLVIRGPISPGAMVSVAVNYDPGWRAEQDGRPLPITRDRIGFMTLAPGSALPIVMSYHGTAEQKIFAALSVFAWIGAIVFRRRL